MSEKKTDRRVIRTKRFIRDALTELLKVKGFEEVTVSDLTEKANINRGTFYLHYRDKYDLLEQSETEIIEEINELAQEFHGINLHGSTLQDLLKQHPFLIKFIEYIAENADFMRVILGPNGDPAFQIKLKEVLKKNMMQNIERLVNVEKLTIPPAYFIAYATSAYLGVIQHWLKSGLKESPQEISAILSKLMLFGPVHILKY